MTGRKPGRPPTDRVMDLVSRPGDLAVIIDAWRCGDLAIDPYGSDGAHPFRNAVGKTGKRGIARAIRLVLEMGPPAAMQSGPVHWREIIAHDDRMRLWTAIERLYGRDLTDPSTRAEVIELLRSTRSLPEVGAGATRGQAHHLHLTTAEDEVRERIGRKPTRDEVFRETAESGWSREVGPSTLDHRRRKY
jgi:hypothetical protein